MKEVYVAETGKKAKVKRKTNKKQQQTMETFVQLHLQCVNKSMKSNKPPEASAVAEQVAAVNAGGLASYMGCSSLLQQPANAICKGSKYCPSAWTF